MFKMLVLVLCFGTSVSAQIHSFVDIRDRLMSTDGVTSELVDALPFYSVRMNGTSICYITNASEIAVITSRGKKTYGTGVKKYIQTNHFKVWWDDRFVHFLDPAKSKATSYAPFAPINNNDLFIKPHAIGDSIAAFVNWNNEIILLENGQVKNLTALGSNNVNPENVNLDWMAWYYSPQQLDAIRASANQVRYSEAILIAGDNILGYTDINGYFRCYYRGKDGNLDEYPPIVAGAGANTLAWVDLQGELKVLWKGKPHRLDFVDQESQGSLQVGDDLVAWLRADEALVAFSNGKQKVVELSGVRTFRVIDQLLIYTAVDGSFNVFHDGEKFRLQQIEPNRFEAWGDRLVFMNRLNRLAGFWEGKAQEISKEVIQDYSMSGPMVQVILAPYRFKYFDY
ncbi:MAG: hypothetical protein ACI959_000887 [Limisphaerales bacterium]|jgi:hypothetical protein